MHSMDFIDPSGHIVFDQTEKGHVLSKLYLGHLNQTPDRVSSSVAAECNLHTWGNVDIPGSVFEPIILYLLKSFSPPFPLMNICHLVIVERKFNLTKKTCLMESFKRL